MTFHEEKALCVADGVCEADGLSKTHGDEVRVVDKCRLTGARCYSQKCPKFHTHIRPTDALRNAGLEKEYEEDMGDKPDE